MPIEELILNAIQGNIVYLLLAVLFVVLVLKAVRIVSQSEQHVIEVLWFIMFIGNLWIWIGYCMNKSFQREANLRWGYPMGLWCRGMSPFMA